MFGVIYLNKGRKCTVRLCVSMLSLRDYWSGPVTLLAAGEQTEFLYKFCEKLSISIIDIPDSYRSLVTKSTLWRYTPYESSMFIDADTLVVDRINDIIPLIAENDFVVHQFSDWRTDGRKISGRIKQWRKCRTAGQVRAALRFGPAVNTGIFGFKKTAAILEPWERLCIAGYQQNCTRRMVDELACQLLLPKYPHKIIPSIWGCSGKFGKDEKPIIYHFHGSKHVKEGPACDLWKKAYWKARNTHQFGNNLELTRGDRRLKRYIAESRKENLTIVTAVNPEYFDRFKVNFCTWMRTPGLMEQKYIVFTNRISNKDIAMGIFKQFRNVKFIRWKFDAAGSNVRERMLSAFMFGTARHVKTDYWMKLDADVTPKSDAFTFPDYQGYDLTAHRWGYTRVKGDPGATEHWLNHLDRKFPFENHSVPPDLPLKSRFGHKRTASFCAIEKTEFTREMVALFNQNGGRMPVPSQDTTSWYFAAGMGKKINRINMKKQLSP